MENKSIWRNKDFILLFTGGFVSRIGSGIHNIALVWFVLELTGSGTTTGILLALSTLPAVLIGPFGGLIADRVNRKLLIVGNDFLRGGIVLILGWAIYSGQTSFFLLGFATVLISISGAFFNPAVSAVFPNLVRPENLEKANSLENISMNFTQIIGAAAGGILIGTLGIAGAFFFNGISFILSGISELFIDIPPISQEADTKESFIADFKFGINFLTDRRELLGLFIIFLFLNFLFGGLFSVGLPYIYNQILEINEMLFGLAKSTFPVGAILGSILINYIAIKNNIKFLGKTLTAQSSLLVLMGLPLSYYGLNNLSVMNIYIILTVLLVLLGILNAMANIPIITIFQKMIPDNLRGRVFGLLGTFTQGLTPISMGLMGILFDHISPSILFIVSGVLAVLISYSIIHLSEFDSLNSSMKEPALKQELI
ncbi:MFS transporter [Halanaerobiaceae bacterium Z-7014]|uniref:MFS transporter n=1 Tax=Halonatronomonas betaini TaxID=2778430 RepID=A0A931ASZ4_9FIRM|nr:MFS transporter [Halonatronomonas betaini]MBF8435631.1 MFS transporter [Halonatronomonas betaini]